MCYYMMHNGDRGPEQGCKFLSLDTLVAFWGVRRATARTINGLISA